ncbi:MAG: flagellar basal body rod protein FlgC [Candidatus Melainabacteria bacterium]
MTLNASFEIASSALAAHSERLKVHANNIANMNTPYYQRKIPVLQAQTQEPFERVIARLQTPNGLIETGMMTDSGGVQVSGVMLDPTPGRRIYQPGHPEADADGFVTLSNVNPLSDMTDAIESQRQYEANLAVVGIVKNMANRAMDIGRQG